MKNREFNTIELIGACEALKKVFGTEEFFYCGGYLCSTSAVNGVHIRHEGRKLQSVYINESGTLIAIFEDDMEKQYFYTVRYEAGKNEQKLFEVKND